MRAIFGLVLVAGLALAGVAVYMVQGFVGANQAELTQERAFRAKLGPIVEVYVTNKPLAYGVALTKDDVVKVMMPKNNIPEGFFEDEAALFPGEYSEPRYVVRQLDKMEPILAAKVSNPGQDVSLTARLSKGMRAFAIKVDVASGVSGFLQPGDVVDVYWTGSTPDSLGERTQLIESSVRIVAVDQTSDAENSTATLIARTVTVEATPEKVARLAQAQATGRLALSLVGSGDNVEATNVIVDSNTLLGIVAEAEVVAAPEEKVCSIKTRKGGADVIETIPCTN